MGRLPPIPESPPELKSTLQKYLKTADEFDKRDPVVAYYCRFFAVKLGIEKFSKIKECKGFLIQIMDIVETDKKALKDTEAMKDEVVAQTTVWTVAMKIFSKADSEDRAGRATKAVAMAFHSAMTLFEVLRCFEHQENDEEVNVKHKYAKWKAAHILKCLREGTTPIAGPVDADGNPMDTGATWAGDDDGGNTGAAAAPPPFRPSLADSFPPPPSMAPTPGGAPTPFAAAAMRAPAASEPQASGGGGEQGVVGAARANLSSLGVVPTKSRGKVSIAETDQASKFCKHAISALQYSDVDTAVENLLKALRLLAQ